MKQISWRLNLKKFSFSHRVVDDWNSLRSKVVEATELMWRSSKEKDLGALTYNLGQCLGVTMDANII